MTKQKIYTYLGTNGIITSPIHLEGIYYTCQIQLVAADKKRITKDGIHFYTSYLIPEEELNQWYEVDDNGQE